MSINEPTITVHGHLTDRPTLRFLENGQAAGELTVAQNPRFRTADGDWRDGETLFIRVKMWRELAETVCESLNKGDRVTVTGRLRRRTWEDNETGKNRYTDEIIADDVAVSLHRQHVKVAKVAREQSTKQETEQQQ